MAISVTPSIVAPSFKQKMVSNPQAVRVEPQPQTKDEKKGYSTKQLSAAVLASTLGSAALVGAIMHGKGSKVVRQLEGQLGNLRDENRVLQNTADELTNLNNRLKARLSAAISDIETSEGRKVFEEMSEKLKDADVNYDLSKPPVVGVKETSQFAKGPDYPAIHTPTTLRPHIEEQYIPQISSEGRFDFKFPESPDMKVTKIESKDFEPMHNVSTSISESYADSVQWDNDKIARDVLQNFFDGHGQTLDGVRLKFEPTANGTYKVRIEGQSTYTPDKAVFIGESTKRNDPNAAGNYGEGLKMAALKLLRDKGAKNVNVGSDNWKISYSLENSSLSDKRVLTYSMDKTPKYDGNYVEFETNDKELLEKLRATLGRFYSSSNTHFKFPDFENEVFGFKKLGQGEKGGLYIAGQRFEFEGSYDGLPEVALYLKRKPPVNVLDPSRDRTSINQSQLDSIAQWLAKNCTTKDEKLKVIKALEKYGEKVNSSEATPMHSFLQDFVYWCDSGSEDIRGVKFPSNYVAYSGCTPDILNELYRSGYKIFDEKFGTIGMRNIASIYGEAQKHTVVMPNEIQKKKLIILKEALQRLASSLEGKHFTPEELDTKIFMFDRFAASENSMYRSAMAEAIVDNGVSKGFWIDKSYLDDAKFGDVLETALHELSHKVGGDSSSTFGYKLTNVNQEVIKQIINDSKTKSELAALNKMWDNLAA